MTLQITADKIVDTALHLAEASSWERLRLFEIAEQLDIPITKIHTYFREKDELIDAFFDRADKAMLKMSTQPELLQLSGQERLHQLLMRWFSLLQNHRKVTREMIWAKLEPGHLHIQFPALMRISRTVQWWREAAQLSASHFRRALEETFLTAVYLMTFIHWLYDDSKEAIATSHFLKKRLAQCCLCS
ncbi:MULTISPECIES: TetR/AcrR family transcriptional regulator [unclassified Legionella]|uniref:TetR/AcrR family transcriptional regulator n=1 Tax=unclassified Legionella TaxID=2622702 RepID=UPI0010557619|nr:MULTISPECIES: TetR/AcrR family transcriptional regulator [unclassified Legionella]MDI9817920.1 TetR/AcrR family transcriptional regulator [Legionella sp. PL877]